jgi:hypothetical protein
MIIQLAAILQPILQAGLQIGTQFLNRELGRDARRDQKQLLKAQAQAIGGGGSFVQAQSPGTVSAPFVARPPVPQVQFAGLGGAVGPVLRGMGRLGRSRAGQIGRRVAPDILGGAAGAAAIGALQGLNGNGRGVAGFEGASDGFILNKATGCLEPKQRGDKGPTFRIDFETGDFVRVKPRRINPANKSAAKRAPRRIDATLNFMSDLVRVSTKRDKGKTVPGGGGKVVTFRTKKRKKVC